MIMYKNRLATKALQKDPLARLWRAVAEKTPSIEIKKIIS